MNPGLWLSRNQYDSILACKKQGSPKWHEFKTEGLSKTLLQLSCQPKPSSPWGYSCPWIFYVQCAACPTNKKGAPIWRGQLLPIHTDTRSSTSLTAATVLLFIDLEETLIQTTEAACLAGSLLFICSYFEMALLLVWFMPPAFSAIWPCVLFPYFYCCSLARAIL